MNNSKAYMNWSGGKDSSLALYHILKDRQFEVNCLLTSVNKTHQRISMHGVRIDLLKAQASAIGLPLTLIELSEFPDMDEYEKALENSISEISARGTNHAIFGDIFLEDLRKYREEKLAPLNISAVFPLWKTPTTELMNEFIELGFKAIVVCVNEKFLDKSFCGRIIDRTFIRDLPENVDVCGENGEYHSFVFDGPIFKDPVHFIEGQVVYREYPKPEESNDCSADKNFGFYFCDLKLTM